MWGFGLLLFSNVLAIKSVKQLDCHFRGNSSQRFRQMRWFYYVNVPWLLKLLESIFGKEKKSTFFVKWMLNWMEINNKSVNKLLKLYWLCFFISSSSMNMHYFPHYEANLFLPLQSEMIRLVFYRQSLLLFVSLRFRSPNERNFNELHCWGSEDVRVLGSPSQFVMHILLDVHALHLIMHWYAGFQA